MSGSPALLRASEVHVVFRPSRGLPVDAVRGVDVALGEGEFVGLVGESGCGKSTLGLALTRMLRAPARMESGSVWFGGEDISRLAGEALRIRRRGGFALVLQSGMNALNPVRVIEDQFADVLRADRRVAMSFVRQRAAGLMERVHLSVSVLRKYPH